MTTLTSSITLADTAEAAARAAGEVAMEGFRKPGLEFSAKSGLHDFVTEYDRRSEIRAREVLSALAPGSRIVGEEDGATGDGELTWYVDPIDGTSNFARGIALWTVCIAAVVDDVVVAGVVFDPVAGHMFRADETGAFLNGEPLRAEGMTVPERATVLATFPVAASLQSARSEKLELIAELNDTYAHVRDLGSAAISICHVAAGWADAVYGFGIHAWDVAAASFILRTAGGTYRTYGGGEELPAAADHHNSTYCGTVAGAQFPLLETILRLQTRP
ncbi:MAG: inositol monophosphatase [Actinobacteria bacterium]|nr:inositol monophosphatase [Actinomycetota bacterium]